MDNEELTEALREHEAVADLGELQLEKLVEENEALKADLEEL